MVNLKFAFLLPRQLEASTCSFKKSTHIFFTGSIWYWFAASSKDWTLLLLTEILQNRRCKISITGITYFVVVKKQLTPIHINGKIISLLFTQESFTYILQTCVISPLHKTESEQNLFSDSLLLPNRHQQNLSKLIIKTALADWPSMQKQNNQFGSASREGTQGTDKGFSTRDGNHMTGVLTLTVSHHQWNAFLFSKKGKKERT